MAKRKIGVSLLAMFAMVLMFSISAMAAGVLNLTANVQDNNLTASWDALGDATQYTVTVTDITDPASTSAVVTDVVVTDPTFSTAVLPSRKYEVKVVSDSPTNTDDATVEVLSYGSNAKMSKDGEAADNNIGNANQTGTSADVEDGTAGTDVIKSVGMVKNDGTTGTHRTHGEYQNNTNSCASCHQTHTGASKALLFKDGVYNTCTACHDGTLGMYNVFEHSNAGTFGGTTAGNMSIHLADGSVQIKAAPGGNLTANSGDWVNEFNCASCHSPHGSYSDRLLHYNPNGMGQLTPDKGGIGLVDAPIKVGKYEQKKDTNGDPLYKQGDGSEGTTVTPDPIMVFNIYELDGTTKVTADESVPSILVRATAADFGLDGTDGLAATDVVIRTYDFTAGKYGAPNKYSVNDAPWLYGYGYKSPNKNYWTRFFVGAGDDLTIIDAPDGTQHYKGVVDNHDQDWNANLHFEWSKGYVYTSDTILDNLTKGNVARAYAVDLDLEQIAMFGDVNGVPIYQSNINALTTGFDHTQDPLVDKASMTGAGVKLSTYCASCHTDYLAHSGSESGTWNGAYRHSTDSDSYTCVRCHYAHGTDVTVMMDAQGNDMDAVAAANPTWTAEQVNNYMLDQNPSSALKRYTNMSVCWGCHTDSKATQLKNTYSYDKSEDPHGLADQPNMPGNVYDPNLDGIVDGE